MLGNDTLAGAGEGGGKQKEGEQSWVRGEGTSSPNSAGAGGAFQSMSWQQQRIDILELRVAFVLCWGSSAGKVLQSISDLELASSDTLLPEVTLHAGSF